MTIKILERKDKPRAKRLGAKKVAKKKAPRAKRSASSSKPDKKRAVTKKSATAQKTKQAVTPKKAAKTLKIPGVSKGLGLARRSVRWRRGRPVGYLGPPLIHPRTPFPPIAKRSDPKKDPNRKWDLNYE